MDPRLVTSKDLRVVTPRRDRGAAPAALALLLAVVALTGAAQARIGDGDATLQAGAVRPSAAAGVTQIPGTQVPMPQAEAGLAALRAKGGLHIFAPQSVLSRADALSLFGFYLDAMPAQGWMLAGKGDPRGAGDWVQRWEAGNAAALLTYTSSPRNRLEIELCPPDPYC